MKHKKIKNTTKICKICKNPLDKLQLCYDPECSCKLVCFECKQVFWVNDELSKSLFFIKMKKYIFVKNHISQLGFK